MASTTTAYVGSYFEYSSGAITLNYYAGAQRLAQRQGGALTWIVGDHLGSSSVTADANGNNPITQLYTAWGAVRWSSGSLPTKYTYTGQYSHVNDFGLLFYQARWFDPVLGRFTQADTMIPGGQGVQAWDRYAYVNNSPINFNDPSGHAYECGTSRGEPCGDWTEVDFINELSNKYGWSLAGEWTEAELEVLWRVGYDIQIYIDRKTNGSGLDWIKSNTGGTMFHHASPINKLLRVNWVLLRNDVYLLGGFNRATVVHELGHVFDNNPRISLNPDCAATWCGQGPADALISFIGGRPGGWPRWKDYPLIPDEHLVRKSSHIVDPKYYNDSTAEYFAQSFSMLIYHYEELPSDMVKLWMEVFISLTTNP